MPTTASRINVTPRWAHTAAARLNVSLDVRPAPEARNGTYGQPTAVQAASAAPWPIRFARKTYPPRWARDVCRVRLATPCATCGHAYAERNS